MVFKYFTKDKSISDKRKTVNEAEVKVSNDKIETLVAKVDEDVEVLTADTESLADTKSETKVTLYKAFKDLFLPKCSRKSIFGIRL